MTSAQIALMDMHVLKFREAYSKLELSITPKLHCLFVHVPEFCLKMKKGLGYYSEQASESVHANFRKTMERYKMRGSTRSTRRASSRP